MSSFVALTDQACYVVVELKIKGTLGLKNLLN